MKSLLSFTMKQQFYFLVLILLLTACSGISAAEKTAEPITEKERVENRVPDEQPEASLKVSLTGKFLREDDYGTREHLVILTINGKDQVIDTVSACETIEAADFDQYDIPKDAIAACGGWWAGAGDYFYALNKNGNVAVYQGWQDEGQEGADMHWERMKIR